MGTMEALARSEKAGRTCIVRDGYFRYAVGSHVVFYRETEYTIDVIRVLHQRMDIEQHL
ncbi:type II toxin-antitoxin system RelE/ParE family toxin [Burkholderia contaminans]|uniref:type II toxin-antitoxin system RelE/ParE family toxin n=1 Tax=Burkholderia contaminans TaxID=488447 RepID=UPI0035E3AFAE